MKINNLKIKSITNLVWNIIFINFLHDFINLSIRQKKIKKVNERDTIANTFLNVFQNILLKRSYY